VKIPFAATALSLGFPLVTVNYRHFRLIPGLHVIAISDELRRATAWLARAVRLVPSFQGNAAGAFIGFRGNEMRDAMRKDAGLSASGGGEDQQRTFRAVDSLALPGI
jgi:hypothetical protein